MNNKAYNYLKRYLKVAPLSHALWRSIEACELSKYKLKRPILDIGCGFGEFGGVFFSSQVEVGVDIDYQEIARAAATGKYKKTVVADARSLPFGDNSFATVISISTLEHIPNNKQVFKEAFRVLAPGGSFIFSVPTNKLYDGLLGVKLFNLFGLRELSYLYFRALNKAFKHVFLPQEETWLKIAKSCGFEIEKVTGTISQITLSLWELGLPLAVPSQLTKIFLGKRLVMAADFKAKIFRPLSSLIKSDPDFRANIFVVCKKP